MMNYFKAPNGEVFAYDDDQVAMGCVLAGLVRMDENEVKRHLSEPIKTREQVGRARLIAYADPVSGSDRFRSEADAERLLGNEAAALEAEKKMLERREQIKLENPWPLEV